MTQEDLQEFARRQPFEPFRVVLTTGDVFDIRHPDLIMIGRRSAVIGITNDSASTAYDRTLKVDLLHIVSAGEVPSNPPNTNGTAG